MIWFQLSWIKALFPLLLLLLNIDSAPRSYVVVISMFIFGYISFYFYHFVVVSPGSETKVKLFVIFSIFLLFTIQIFIESPSPKPSSWLFSIILLQVPHIHSHAWGATKWNCVGDAGGGCVMWWLSRTNKRLCLCVSLGWPSPRDTSPTVQSTTNTKQSAPGSSRASESHDVPAFLDFTA